MVSVHLPPGNLPKDSNIHIPWLLTGITAAHCGEWLSGVLLAIINIFDYWREMGLIFLV